MKQVKRRYTQEFKEEAVKLANEQGASKVSADLDVNVSVIRRWVREEKDKGLKANSSDLSNADLLKKVRQLEKENYYLKEINKVLKKSTAIFSKDQFPDIK